MKKFTAALAGAALLATGALALAQSYPPPQVQGLNPNDLIKVVPNGNPAVGDQWAPGSLLGNYGPTLPGNNPENAIIGGDGNTNLFQRGTTGASETTTVTYGGPDRWAYWSGTSTAVTVNRDSTAADLPPGYKYAISMQRTSGQTGVVQTCMMQEIETANAIQFAGQTAELDFHAATGANFSAASANMTAYIIYGTGSDEGVAGTTSAAYGLNAGGGGSGSWTGQVNVATVVGLGGVSTLNRYSVVANIPATATELGVALCFKPVGTAGTNDYVAFDGIQLVRNSALTSVAAGAASTTAGVLLNTNDLRAKSFLRRLTAVETALQQRYFYQINEPAASKIVSQGGAYETATICDVAIKLPVTMRAAPTLTLSQGSATTWAVMSKSTTPVVLASTWLIQDAVIGNTADTIALQATTASTTAGFACELVGAGGGATLQASAEL